MPVPSRRKPWPATEAQVRPVFQLLRGLSNVPGTQLATHSHSSGAGGTEDVQVLTTDIQPPVGQLWRLVYAAMTPSAASLATNVVLKLQIQYTDDSGSNFYIMEAVRRVQGDSGDLESDRVSIPGTSPIILSRNKYMRFRSTIGGSSTATVQCVAVFEVL